MSKTNAMAPGNVGMKKSLKILRVIAMMLLGLLLFSITVYSKFFNHSKEHEAWIMCTIHVEEALKIKYHSPNYPRYDSEYVEKLGKGHYRAFSEITYRNNLGNVMAKSFECFAQNLENGAWKIENLKTY